MGDWRSKTDLVMKHCVDAFSEAVKYLPKDGNEFSLNAIFDKEFIEVDPDTGSLIQSRNPRIGVRESDLQREPLEGDRVAIRGVLYRVIDSQSDGQAGTELSLLKDRDEP